MEKEQLNFDVNEMKEKENFQIESKMYVFYEKRDEINNAIENAKDVIKKQERLNKIVSRKEKDAEEFADFLKGSKEVIENYKEQIKTLEDRVAYFEAIIDTFENRKDETAKQISSVLEIVLSYVVEAFGVQ